MFKVGRQRLDLIGVQRSTITHAACDSVLKLSSIRPRKFAAAEKSGKIYTAWLGF